MPDSRTPFVYPLVKLSSKDAAPFDASFLILRSLRHAQILEGNRLLLVVTDQYGKVFVYLDTMAGMDGAIKRNKCKVLHRDKMGQDFHFGL